MVAALSTGHKIGLAVVAGAFIAFALFSSFVAPRRRPDFPGRAGLSVFVIACFAFFAAMIAAVEVFGAESEAKAGQEAAAAPAESAGAAGTIQVREKEFKIVLPAAAKRLRRGRTTFVVRNVGKLPHDLEIQGPKVKSKTPLIAPGRSAKLTVALAKGVYTLWCTVPGHRQLGMVARLKVS